MWQDLHSVALELKALEVLPLEAFQDWLNKGGCLEVMPPSQYYVGSILLVSPDLQKVTMSGDTLDRPGVVWVTVMHTPYRTFLQLGWGDPKMRYRKAGK